MRVSWTNWRRLTVLMATVATLHGAGAASAQSVRYGYQDQTQLLNNTPQQSRPADATPPYTLLPVQPKLPTDTSGQQVAPQYTPVAYLGDDSVPVEPIPAQDGDVPAQGAPVVYQGGCEIGCNYYNTFENGSSYKHGSYSESCYGTDCLQGCRSSGQSWFGGVYGLLMERDDNTETPLAFVTTNGVGSYPTDAEIALTASDADIDFQGGLEVRFGAYFGGHRGDNCGCGPSRAWEAVYWGIFEDSNTTVITDVTVDANRTHGMIDFDGLQFDPGGGARSVNVFFDTGLPITDNSAPVDVEVRSFSVRGTFQVQNAEANLLRLPVLNGGGQSRYSLTTLLGARFMRIDDDFLFRSDFEIDPAGAATLGSLAYDVETDNSLYGVQLGGNGSYRVGSGGHLSLHCNTAVGLYGNHMEVTQRITGATFVTGGAPMVVESDEDDVSVVGEMRVGASYQPHNNWRFYAGWRLVGLTGIARTTDQIPSQFVTPGQVGVVHSDGSLLIHGLQTGMEFSY